MPKEPDWTEKEFTAVLLNPHSTNEEISAINGRSVGAISTVRAFIHNYHIRGNISGLSQLMINRLNQGYWECPLCHHKVIKDDFPANKGWVR